ncbi:MAG: trypsin-like peptidase domain-containing protein [Myxococcales bacterium]|nr:trypsin-like peptidase domain-containing protein [Myxococcales bacterium]
MDSPTSRALPLMAAILCLSLPAGAKVQAPARQLGAPAGRAEQLLPSIAPLVESVKAAVVNVDVRSKRPAREEREGEDLPELFEEFFGHQLRPPGPQIRQGTGSGFLIEQNGLVLTNNHVVEDAVSIRVTLDDGREFDARVLGRDPLTDVAVLRLEGNPKNLPAVTLGDSDAVQIGDWVLAIGNPFGLASSVSLGILSARARQIGTGPFDDFLQTDAAINPGNSGGPLFNMRGEVVGMTTAIVGVGTGIGFAVPSNLIRALLPSLERGKPVERGWLGISVQDLTPDLARALGVPVSAGAVVADVEERAPAAKAGIQPQDAIVALNGRPVESASDLTRRVALERPGAASTLTLYRGQQRMELRVTLGTRPDIEGLGRPRPEEREKEKRLGVTFQTVDPRAARERGMPSEGALVTAVLPGSPAERADLRPGMVVVEAGGKPIKRAEDLRRVLSDAKKGSVVLLRVAIPGGFVLRGLPIPG